MLYKSTRGESPIVPFSEVLLGGLAPDGGLYMPANFPKLTSEEINSFVDFTVIEPYVNRPALTNILIPYYLAVNMMKLVIAKQYVLVDWNQI